MTQRIVIAEDEPDIRANLARLLTLENFQVWAAPNGEEALALVREHRPDLLLSDVMMPRMDGHALIRALRADPDLTHIPAILLTARAEHRDRREGMNLGADDYLVKPFRRDELLEAVRSRLNRTSVQQQAHQRLQDQAARLMRFDALTGLPNRDALLQSCQDLLAGPSGVTMVVVAVAGIADINQALGHAGGDLAVCQLAQRLQQGAASLTWPQACVHRIADWQFGLLLPQAPAQPAMADALAQLGHVLAQPYKVQGRDMQLRTRMGVAVAVDAPAPQDLLRQAEVALHQAADAPIAYFDPAGDVRMMRRMQIHMDLHQAMALEQFSLHYQPQVDVQTAELVGFEALLRWQHPVLGMISPAEFIPIAEESDLIVPIGRWALQEACRQLRAWQEAGLPLVRLAVNLSSRQFEHPAILEHVQLALEHCGLEARWLELEITESVALRGLEHTLSTMAGFRALGLALSIDDFGTGYSSLSYLKRFPVDALKIDQSFVRTIDTDAGDAAIARAVVALAHSFGMKVIAEGVETPAQRACLQALGCEFAQGYLFSRPLPAEEARSVLERGHCQPP